MKKLGGTEYIVEVLEEYGCENFKGSKDEIRCGCPYHSPKGSSNAFKVVFPRDREPFFHCHRCKENGDLPTLISFLQKVSYKRAIKRIGKKTSLGRVSIEHIADTLDDICNAFKDIHSKKSSIDTLPERFHDQTPMMEYMEARKKRSHNILDVEWLIRKYSMYYCHKDRMSGRIIMPINIGGRQISYNDRSVYDKTKLKSLHPQEGNFEDYVHGIDESARKKVGIIVEGSFDMFQVMSFLKEEGMLETHGCVCLMNATITQTKANLIAETFSKAVLLLDHDDAGLEGTWSGHHLLDELIDTECRTHLLPKGLDPGRTLPSVLERVLFGKLSKKKSFIDGVLGI